MGARSRGSRIHPSFLMTGFFPRWHMCEMDVGYLEWEGSDGGPYKELGHRQVGPTHTCLLAGLGQESGSARLAQISAV